MSEYVDFHYMPLEGKITGKQVLQQTEDAINDLGNKVYNLNVDEERIDEAIESSEQAINTANSALAAVTTDRAVWKNTVAEMKATDIDLGVTAATRGKTVFNDGNGAFYGVRSEKSGDVDSGDTVFLNNGNVAERIQSMNIIAKGNNIIFVANVAELIDSDARIGNVYGTTGYYSANDGGAGLYSIRTKKQSDVEDGGSIIFLDNGNVAELITDGTVDVKQFGAYGDGVHDDTIAIQNALDYGYRKETTDNVIFVVTARDGNFLVTDSVWIDSSVDMMGANIYADGTSVTPVVKVGTLTNDYINLYSKTVKLPNVYNFKNGALTSRWDGTGIGVEFYNLDNSNIYVCNINGFTNGLVLNPTYGNAYNSYFLQAIINCKVCLKITKTGSGWANENIFYNGRFSASKDSNDSWTGTRQILFEGGNNLLFIKPSIESASVEYSIEMKECSYCTFLQARYEGSGAKKVAFSGDAAYSVIGPIFIGGYQLNDVNFITLNGHGPYYFGMFDYDRSVSRQALVHQNGGIYLTPYLTEHSPTLYSAKLDGSGFAYRSNYNNTSDNIFVGTKLSGRTGFYLPVSDGNNGTDYANGFCLYTYGSAVCVNKSLNPRLVVPEQTVADINLGSANYKWANIYAVNGTIQTSDEREKQDIEPIDDAVFRAWGKVNFVQYRFRDAVSKKGDKARIHFGLIAQQVKEAFESEGLDAFDYGLLCYDEWEADTETDEDGNVTVVKEAGNRYGIRYDEALALECAYQRWLNNKA